MNRNGTEHRERKNNKEEGFSHVVQCVFSCVGPEQNTELVRFSEKRSATKRKKLASGQYLPGSWCYPVPHENKWVLAAVAS